MRPTALVLALTAGSVVAIDLTQKALALSGPEPVVGHERSLAYVLAGVGATMVWAAAIVLVGSVPIAFAGGIAVGGAIGNLSSLVLFPSFRGVPDPLVVGRLAFNLGDVAVVVGLCLVVSTTIVFAFQNRARLREPVRVRS
jgi:lipoprotein signal peptidase